MAAVGSTSFEFKANSNISATMGEKLGRQFALVQVSSEKATWVSLAYKSSGNLKGNMMHQIPCSWLFNLICTRLFGKLHGQALQSCGEIDPWCMGSCASQASKDRNNPPAKFQSLPETRSCLAFAQIQLFGGAMYIASHYELCYNYVPSRPLRDPESSDECHSR